jgi:D-galactarolactone isomerase
MVDRHLAYGATDCHHHVYDARYPVAHDATLTPPDATVGEYRAIQRRLGLSRNVVVQPSTYGTDNRLLCAALRDFGDSARGVAVVDPAASRAALGELHECGVRGVRLNFRMGRAGIHDVRPIARLAAEQGWHLQVLADPAQLENHLDVWAGLPVPLVLDHLALLPPDRSAPGWNAVRRLLDGGGTWVKLSGIELLGGGPDGVAPFLATGRELAAHAPERMVWGTNWPHPSEPVDSRSDPHGLIDALAAWVPDPDAQRAVLVDNPERLYGFASTAARTDRSAAAPQRYAPLERPAR